TISGGATNFIGSSWYCTIAGGLGNEISGFDDTGSATIGGGQGNRIHVLSPSATIAGGGGNDIEDSITATIGGGEGNVVTSARGATIAGGWGNQIQSPDPFNGYAAVGGGASNSVNSVYATIPGGAQANARNYGQMAYASGQFAAPGDAQTSVYVCRATTT